MMEAPLKPTIPGRAQAPAGPPARGAILLNALSSRTGGVLTRIEEVVRRAPGVWGREALVLRTAEARLSDLGPRERPTPAVYEAAPIPLRRLLDPVVLAGVDRHHRAAAVLHYCSHVPYRARFGPTLLCVTNMAPWDPGPGGASLRNRLLRRLFERTATAADLVVVQSAATRDALAARYPALSGRLRVVRNGVATPRLQRPAQRRGFLAVGDVHAYRRYDALVEAYAALPASVRREHPLLLAGSDRHDPPARARLGEAVWRHGLESDVSLLGPLSRAEVLDRMACARAYVSFASAENGPNALLEAAVIGVPLVLSSLPVHREYAAHAGGRVVAFVGNVAELSEALAAVARGAHEGGAGPIPARDLWRTHMEEMAEVLAEVGVVA